MSHSNLIRVLFRPLTDAEEQDTLDNPSRIIDFQEAEPVGTKSKYERMEIPLELRKDANEKLQEKLNNFTLATLDGSSVMEMLKYDSIYLWYYHRFRIFFRLRELFYQIEIVENHIQSGSEIIQIYTEESKLAEYFKGHDNIIVVIKTENKTAKVSKLTLLNYAVKTFIRGISSITKLNKIRDKRHLIIVNDDHLSNSKNGANHNYYGDLLLKGSPSDFAVIRLRTIDKDGTQKAKIKELNCAYSQISSESVLLRSLISDIKIRKRVTLYLNQLDDNIDSVRSGLEPINRLFIDEFKSLRKSSKYYLIQYECFKKFFIKSNIKTISTISEHSSNERAILDAGKSASVHTIGIQHGFIGKANVSYNFLKSEAKYSPIPNHNILWGGLAKSYLTEQSCYADNQIHVLGQLKSDAIQQYVGLSTNDVYPNLDGNTHVVVFASQPQKDEGARKNAANMVIQLSKNRPNLQVIIKMHPAESFDYYNELLRENRISDVILVKNEKDLYELLSIASVVLTCFSTVGAEAIYFGKPLITIDPSAEDIAGYNENKVAISIKDAQELIIRIDEILGNKIHYNEHYDQFISDTAFRVDGNVTKRYLEYINSLA